MSSFESASCFVSFACPVPKHDDNPAKKILAGCYPRSHNNNKVAAISRDFLAIRNGVSAPFASQVAASLNFSKFKIAAEFLNGKFSNLDESNFKNSPLTSVFQRDSRTPRSFRANCRFLALTFL